MRRNNHDHKGGAFYQAVELCFASFTSYPPPTQSLALSLSLALPKARYLFPFGVGEWGGGWWAQLR